MALSIGVRKGFKYRVGESTIRVKEVPNAKTIVLTLDGAKDFTITDKERVEIIPNVFVSCGASDHVYIHENHSRLAFEAPKSIKIERIRAVARVPRERAEEGGSGRLASG